MKKNEIETAKQVTDELKRKCIEVKPIGEEFVDLKQEECGNSFSYHLKRD